MRGLALSAVVALVAWSALSGSRAHAGDFLYGCAVPGADGGTLAKLTIQGGNQFMVSCANNPVRYLVCADAGCSATSTSAPISADQQVDLCAPTSFTTLSFFKTYDAGNPTCCAYKVTPKTVCQTQ